MDSVHRNSNSGTLSIGDPLYNILYFTNLVDTNTVMRNINTQMRYIIRVIKCNAVHGCGQTNENPNRIVNPNIDALSHVISYIIQLAVIEIKRYFMTFIYLF